MCIFSSEPNASGDGEAAESNTPKKKADEKKKDEKKKDDAKTPKKKKDDVRSTLFSLVHYQ